MMPQASNGEVPLAKAYCSTQVVHLGRLHCHQQKIYNTNRAGDERGSQTWKCVCPLPGR
jgi:hypothetical protein